MKAFHRMVSRDTFRKMLSYGLPLLPHRLQGVVMVSFGSYMVRQMLGLEQAGLYMMAIMLVTPLSMIVATIQVAWVPLKFQIHTEEDDPGAIFRSIVTYYIVGVSYLLVGIAVWAPEVLRVMTEASFHDASSLIPIVALIPAASGVYWMVGTGFEMSDSTKPLPLVSFFGLVTLVALAFLLVPTTGAHGAGIATVGGWLVMAVAIYHFAQKRFPVSYDWFVLISLGACACLAVAGSVLMQIAPLGWRLTFAIATSVIYPILALITLFRSRTERRRMQVVWLKLKVAVGW